MRGDDPLSTDAEPSPHPAHAGRAGYSEVVQHEPRLAELSRTRPDLGPPRLAGADEAAELAERFGWHQLDLEDVLSKRQRPKIDEYPDYLFVVLHFPVYDKAIQRLNAAELDLFLGEDYLVTLPSVELLPVTRLFGRCEEDEELREQLFGKGSGYLSTTSSTTCSTTASRSSTRSGTSSTRIEDDMFEAAPRRSSATSPT